jgi:fibronectin-binding autotransporter adhesin
MNASFLAASKCAANEKPLRIFLLIALLALVLHPQSLFAQSCPGTTSWNGGTGSWETAGNWSSGVPGATSNACINVASSTVNITSTSGDSTLNLDINLGTDILNIGNNTQLTIQSGGNILNNGALNLNSSANTTELIIDGATTLSGTGTVTMSNNTNNYITGGGTFTNNQTIQGAGNIGNNNLTLVNSGSTAIIDANVSSTLQINPNGGTTNTGTLEATAGGVLELSGSTAANTGGLILATGNSGGMSPTPSTVELNNVSITGGTLTSSSGGVIESVDTWNSSATPTLTGVTISTGSTVNVPNNNGLNLGAGTITNNGTINLQSTSNNTELVIAGSTTLSGSGSVTMSNNANNIITGGGTLTNGETIQGAGNFGNGDLTLINNGTINANQTTALNVNPNGGTTNNATMEATAGGTLELSGSTIANGSGLIQATGAGSTVQLNDVSITGGTLTSSTGGLIESVNTWNSGATPTLTNVTISTGSTVNVPNNNGLNLGAGTITNNGTVNLQSAANNTELVIAGSTTLSGTGSVTMSNNTANIITGGGTLTNNETIQGAGDIGNASLTLINNGTIDANQSTALTINPIGGTTNTKTMEATAGGTLHLLDYTITNTGGTILATGTNSVVTLDAVSISNGTLTSSSGGVIESVDTWNSTTPTLTNVTLSSGSTLDIPNNNGLNLGAGTITNNGTINLQSTGNNTELVTTGGNVTLTGGGAITMSAGNANNMILAGAAGQMLTNVNNTISGTGQIGNGGGLLFVNDAAGIVDASGGTLTIAPYNNTTGSTTNQGLLEATAGGTLLLENTVTNTGGTILATGSGALVNLSNVSITGGTLTSNSGGAIQSIVTWNSNTPTLTSLTISSGTTLDIPNNNGLALGAGTITNNGTINLQSTANNTELTVAGSTTLSGTGNVTMSNNSANYITGGGTFTNAETIQGGGAIGNGNLTFVNNGTVDANQPTALTINANGGTTNTKTMEATAGGTLHLLDYTITNTGGTILATGTGSVVTLDAVSISGGTLSSSAGGILESVNTWNSNVPTLTGVTISAGSTLDIPNNDGLELGAGTITNKGTINLESTSNNTELVIDGNVTLASTGKVIMSANPNNIITGTGTLTNQNTIEGEGNIGDGQIGIDNSGTIEANATKAPFDTLIIDAGGTGFTNDVGTKQGTLSVSKSNVLNIEGTFNNFASGTLTGGIYKVTGTLEFAAGSGLVTNDAAITLTGATAEILNTSNSTNALTQFADNGTKGTFTLATNTFNDANVFTNSGTIAVGAGAKFNASNQLTNFNSTTNTLTGGSYTLTGTGQFQFNNQGNSMDIVTNDAKITLAGVDTTKNSFIDQTGANALANYDANGSSGALYLTTNRNYTTPGNFSNAGIVDVEKSTGTGHTELTINGTYTQTGGTTTVDGLLNATAFDISGGFVYGNAGTVAGAATLTGNFDITGGTINPGDGVKKAGKLNISGTYTQSGSGILNIDLDGTTAGTNYDVLDISGAATLGGTLDVDAIGTYKPTAGQQYDILDYSSVSGAFTSVDCTFSNGDGCTIAYDGTEAVLTITAAPGAANSSASGAVSATPAHRVSRTLGDASAANAHEPVAILSRATCFAARMIGSACGDKASAATVSRGSDLHEVASAHTELNSAHNNVMVATRSISSGHGGASHETSASASAMARLYVCAYLPSTVGHTMGCN